MVRDLWALRLQLVEEKHGELSETETESRMYSSQTEFSDAEDEQIERLGRREKDMPTLIDILGLCYMGMMLLRLPVSLGELHKYVLRLLPRSLLTLKQMGCLRRDPLYIALAPDTSRHES